MSVHTMSSSSLVELGSDPPPGGPISSQSCKQDSSIPSSIATGAKSYFPDASVIASTNLNLSRMTSPSQTPYTSFVAPKPQANYRSGLSLQKQDSFVSISNHHRTSLSKTLNHHPSKLDLIDDTTLTSLPLPPPLKPKSRASTSGSTSSNNPEKEGSIHSVDSKALFSAIPTQHNQDIDDIGEDETFENETFDDDEDDDEDGDHQDPIVLIEDYMAQQKSFRTPYNDQQQQKSSISSLSAKLGGSIEDPAYIAASTPCINTSRSFRHDNDINDEHTTLINKKRSLATFKQRIFNNTLHYNPSANFHERCGNDEIDSISDVSTFTSTTFTSDSKRNNTTSHTSHFQLNTSSSFHSTNKPKNKRTISNDFVPRPSLGYSKSENLEQIFGKIPGTDLLKYCELCEKPLYEISSIINNNKKFKRSRNRKPLEDSAKVNQVYNEFICGECVETYEEFFNELYQNELNPNTQLESSDLLQKSESTNDDIEKQHDSSTFLNTVSPSAQLDESSKELKLLDIFQNIQNKYDKQQVITNISSKRSFYHKPAAYKRLSNKTSFSENLIGKLNYLNSIPKGFTYSSENMKDQQLNNSGARYGFGSFGFGFNKNSGEANNSDGDLNDQKRVIDLEWIKSLQSKLRWTWGFNGSVTKNSLESEN